MRKVIGIGAWFALAAAGHGAASAGVVADYQDDFTYPAATVGWTYRWNANGPIGTAANYVSLVPDGASPARYETQNQTPDAFPDAAPGGSLSATATTLTPGYGTNQDGNPIERYVIAAYSFSAADIAANGSTLKLESFSFAVDAGSTGGVTARMYLNDIPLIAPTPLGPGLMWDDSMTGSIEFTGLPIMPGDTFYVGIGSDGAAVLPPTDPQGSGSNAGDVITVDYTLALVPEPTGAAIAMAGATLLLLRRQRRRK